MDLLPALPDRAAGRRAAARVPGVRLRRLCELEGDRRRAGRGRRGPPAARAPRARAVQGPLGHPGRFLEEGEHPLDGLRRELREETGLEVEPLEFLGVWMDRYGGDSTAEATLNLYWTARVTGGEAAPADDVDDLRWFERDELPEPGELAFENVPLVLAAWQQHAQRARLDR